MTDSRLQRAANFLFLLPEVLLTNRQIARDSENEDPLLLDELWEIAGTLDEDGRAAARDISADDASRLRRLEDKLSGQSPIAALLLTPLVAVLGVALHRSSWVALLLASVAVVYVAAAVYLTSTAARATPTAIPQSTHLRGSDSSHPLHEYSHEQLRAVPFNAPRGWQLANAIYGAQRCLFRAAVLLVASALVLAAGSYGSGTAQPFPQPSPKSSPSHTP